MRYAAEKMQSLSIQEIRKERVGFCFMNRVWRIIEKNRRIYAKKRKKQIARDSAWRTE